jgi:hypothetical protein
VLTDTDPCEVCRSEQAEHGATTGDYLRQDCPRCGSFKLSGSAQSLIRTALGKARRAQLSGWVRAQNNAGVVPLITSTVLNNVLDRPKPSVSERAFGLLQEAERGLESLGDRFRINEPRFLAASFSVDDSEVEYLARVLGDLRMMELTSMDGEGEILPNGYLKLDELRSPTGGSIQAFIAMWFDGSLADAFDKGHREGVFRAGYDPVRIDRVEHINRIDDEIIRQINASKFLVADFTGHRGGVYFEAGYALGKSIPVFWTCRKSDLGQLHFDIRQFNCIDWESPEDLAKRLSSRIEAVLGPGPKKVGA